MNRTTLAAIATISISIATPALAGNFVPPAPAPTPVSVGAAPRWVPVCGRGRPLGYRAYDATP